MIKLDIGYDPSIPDSMQNMFYHQGQFEAELDAEPQPRWPYAHGAVTVLGIKFVRKAHRTPGPDPYAGESWSAKIGRLEIRLSDLVCDEGEISWSGRRIHRVCECEPKRMPTWWRTLWSFLEDRYRWWERQTPEDEFYYWGER